MVGSKAALALSSQWTSLLALLPRYAAAPRASQSTTNLLDLPYEILSHIVSHVELLLSVEEETAPTFEALSLVCKSLTGLAQATLFGPKISFKHHFRARMAREKRLAHIRIFNARRTVANTIRQIHFTLTSQDHEQDEDYQAILAACQNVTEITLAWPSNQRPVLRLEAWANSPAGQAFREADKEASAKSLGEKWYPGTEWQREWTEEYVSLVKGGVGRTLHELVRELDFGCRGSTVHS